MTYQLYIILLIVTTKYFNVINSNLLSVNNSDIDVSITLENKCIFKIINNHFEFGSTTVIVTSGLQNYTSQFAFKFAPDVTMSMIMESYSPRLSIYVRQALNFKHSKVNKPNFMILLLF